MTDEQRDELKQQERHYRPGSLARVFAISSILLLVSVVWMVIADYQRDWKEYQREFNELEIARVQQEIEAGRQALDQARLAEMQDRLAAAEAEVAQAAEKVAAIDDEMAGMANDLYVADQNVRFTKALLDVAKYEFEEARRHDPEHAEDARAEMERLAADLERYRDEDKRVRQREDELREERDKLTEGADTIREEIELLTRDIDSLQRALASLDRPVVNAVLNAPVVDFVNPTLQITKYQKVLDGIENDYNFLRVPRVDRCQTCHLGIAKPHYAEAEQPFRTHPDLDLIGATGSPHPFDTVGCTICHMGRDRGTSFHGAAHMPGSLEEAHRWEEEHHWHRMHHWDNPMFPEQYAEAGCLQCHKNDVFIPGAEKLSRGKLLWERLGCHGCHKVAGWEGLRKVGPPLGTIATKTTREWVKHWITDPRGFRPTTRMPKFWFLENSRSPEDKIRNNVEIEGVVEYLFANSRSGTYAPPEIPGDAARGKAIVETIGCHGCHSAIGPQEEHAEADPRPHGPNLMRIGDKTDPGWLYQWVRNPKNYWPETVMADLRLTRQEASDVTAYLESLSDPAWKNDYRDYFDVDPADMDRVRDDIVKQRLMRRLTVDQADAELAKMSPADKKLMVGELAIARYGCFGCHEIPGFEEAQRIGIELTKEGSKFVKQLDFGFIDLPRERQDWFLHKLRHPRSFDTGKVKKPDERLKMPQFDLTEEEAEALVTVLMGLRNEEVDLDRRKRPEGRHADIQAGWRLIRDYNCTGCHLIEGRGGDIRPWIQQIKARDGVSATEALAFAPPNLQTQGAKVQSDWLFDFVKNVFPIRPWLEVRMPSFHFEDQKVNTLTTFFAALEDAPYPFLYYRNEFDLPRHQEVLAEKLASRDYLNCLSCHVVGERTPKTPPDSWAPDLSMARNRLRADWIRRWLRNPQDIMPGTRMPSFFLDEHSGPPDILDGDEAAQIELLTDWVMSLGEATPYPEAPAYEPPEPSPLIGSTTAAVPVEAAAGAQP